jgi:hypothetical protein
MAISKTSVERRLQKAMTHFGDTVTVSGADYRCMPTTMRDTELQNRGQTFRENYRGSIVISTDDVTIDRGGEVTYNGTVRRVLDLEETPDGFQRILHLGKRFGG